MDNKTTPLLSICIPTYNRAEHLEKCLEAIVNQECFDNQVEVVISDNCSTDDTQTVSLRYQEKYSNINYFRNEKNVKDENYPLVLRRATGLLRKLTNDTLIYQPGAIKLMLKAAEENANERPQVYFLNMGRMEPRKKEVNNLEEYISIISFHLTWIGSFTIWEDDCEDLDLFVEKAYTRLAQVPFAISNFEKRGKAVIYDDYIMTGIDPQKKDLTYGLYNVFYTTFLGFLQECVDAGTISNECYQRVRKDLLLEFFSTWIVNTTVRPENYRLSDENLKKLVEKEYCNESYFPEYKQNLRQRMLKERIRKLIGR